METPCCRLNPQSPALRRKRGVSDKGASTVRLICLEHVKLATGNALICCKHWNHAMDMRQETVREWKALKAASQATDSFSEGIADTGEMQLHSIDRGVPIRVCMPLHLPLIYSACPQTVLISFSLNKFNFPFVSQFEAKPPDLISLWSGALPDGLVI